jgi:hypothetical protein
MNKNDARGTKMRQKDPLREFVKELLSIEGVEEVFLKYFPLPLTPRLKRAFDKWFDKTMK